MATAPLFEHALTVLHAYKEYYELWKSSASPEHLPKLLLCVRQTHGHDSGDFFASITSHIALHMKDLQGSIVMNRIKPPEQVWNTLLSKAELVILFYDPEDYEERFLEAVHKGKAVLRTEPLGPYGSLVENRTNVSTVGVADFHAMSQSLFQNVTLGDHQDLCNFPPNNAWDEFTTAGNSVNWFYLASTLTKGKCIEPNGEYIYRLAQGRAKDTS